MPEPRGTQGRDALSKTHGSRRLTSHDIAFRTACAADTAPIVSWFPTADAARSWGGPAVPTPLTADWLAQEIGRDDHLYRLALHGGAVAGIYGLLLVPGEGRGHLRRLAVAPSLRRQGLGRRLIADATQQTRLRGFRRLTLNVYGSNAEARAAYERLGWQLRESTPAHEDPSGLRLQMEFLIADERS
jgi:ribosomal protein S18 acetylase RimI-like enzyme